MAEAKIIIRLVDQATAGLKSLKTAITTMRQHWLLLAGTIGTLTSFLFSSLKAFSEQESAIIKLNQALKTNGNFSKEASEELQKYADFLQRTTGFQDEQILSSHALAASYGLTIDQIKKVSKAAADLAVKFEIDLRTATLFVAKAASGATDTLGKFGITIEKSSNSAQRFENTMLAVAGAAGGAAQAQFSGFDGTIKKLSISFNELQETIGSFLKGNSSRLISWATTTIDYFDRVLKKISEYIEKQKKIDKESSQSTTEYFKALDKERKKYETSEKGFLKRLMDWGQQKIGIEQKYAETEKEVTDKISRSKKSNIKNIDEESQKFIEAKTKEIEEHGKTEAQKDLLQAAYDAERLRQLEQGGLAEQLVRNKQTDVDLENKKKREEKDKELNNKMVASTRIALSGILALNVQHSKEMIALQKAAGIANVIISTSEAIMGVWSWAAKVPFIGKVLAGALIGIITAASAAQLAAIGGAKLAQGGIVLPRQGGTLATVAEAGSPEAVIPLGDERATEQIREAIGGGVQVIFNISGNVIADRSSFQEFVRMIDEELFRINRNRKSVAF